MEWVEELYQITENVWTSVLGVEPIRAEASVEALADKTALLTSSVRISGTWDGTVLLNLPPSFARWAASVMFEIPSAQISDSDVRDALGELVNMIGGNLKALLPGPSQLSLPSIETNANQGPELGHLVCRIAFIHEGQELYVTLIQGIR